MKVDKEVKSTPAMSLDQYFRQAYSGELDEALATDEEKAQDIMEGNHRSKAEFTGEELEHLSHLLHQLLQWQPENRIS